jgi:YVTN family beta-propeller protein
LYGLTHDPVVHFRSASTKKIMKRHDIRSPEPQQRGTGSIRLKLHRQFLFPTLAVLIGGAPVMQTPAQEAGDAITTDTAPTNKVVATIRVGNGPHVIAVSPDDITVYVANLLNNTISVIDASTNKVKATYSAGSFPDGLAVTPDGNLLYVANYTSSGTVSIINASTGALVKQIPVGDDPRYLQISPDGSLAYVANQNSGTISVIDTATQSVTTSITIGSNASSATFSPNGSLAYATEDFTNTVDVIDTTTSSVEKSITTTTDPVYCVVNPKGKQDVYVLNFEVAKISVIQSDKVIKTFKPGEVPGFPAITPNGSYLYVPESYISGTTPGDTVVMVSTGTYKRVGNALRVGKQPSWVAISHKGNAAYVSNYVDNTVSAIKITPAQ